MRKEILRLIDANFNRSREGLRVCEDISRFMLNCPSLSRELKAVRHGITQVLRSSSDDIKLLFAARDSERDVGKKPMVKSEARRGDVLDIFTANLERVKESVRVLEEFFKLTDKRASARLCDIRFKIYDIEKRSVGKIATLRDIR